MKRLAYVLACILCLTISGIHFVLVDGADSEEPASSIGVSLMSAAFGGNGKMKHPGAAVSQEQEGLHQMMRGAIAWFKNPISQRSVPRDDAQQAAHVIAFANVLLDLLDECQ